MKRETSWKMATRIASIAALEAILVAIFHDVSRFTVFVLAAIAVVTYFYGGRRTRSDTFRQTSWIFAVSQLLAVIAVILAWIVKWALIMDVVVFAVLGLVYLFLDRR